MKKLFMYIMLVVTLQATPIGISEKLGTYVPLDLEFINEKGEKITLKKLMNGKPLLLSLNYFRCAGICTPQLEDMAKMLPKIELAENIDYKALTVSFAEDETPPLAAAKRKTHFQAMHRPYTQDAWHFVIGTEGSSRVLSDAVGFGFEKTVSKAGVVDYIHPATLVALSPEGKITRYLNGIRQNPVDAKMAILEAADGRVGSTIAKAIQTCFTYDPVAKTYVFAWEKVMATVILIITVIFFIWLVKTGRKEQESYRDEDHQN